MNVCVSVLMITYNHEPFIAEAIEGVLMQKTNFPIELIIGEDCSTDNTRSIVKEYETKYPEIIVAQYPETNRGMMNNFITIMQSARGKYIALCEGDDYWTDPLKLQKQVDFLEKNPEYVACFHDFNILNQETREIKSRKKPALLKHNIGFCFSSFWDSSDWITQPLTAVFRNESYDRTDFLKYNLTRDVHLFYHILNKGKGFWFNECMGVYRHHSGGIFSMKNHEENLDNSYFIYYEIAKCNKKDKRALKFFSSLSALNFKNLVFKRKKSKLTPAEILKNCLVISPKFLFITYLRIFKYIGNR